MNDDSSIAKFVIIAIILSIIAVAAVMTAFPAKTPQACPAKRTFLMECATHRPLEDCVADALELELCP